LNAEFARNGNVGDGERGTSQIRNGYSLGITCGVGSLNGKNKLRWSQCGGGGIGRGDLDDKGVGGSALNALAIQLKSRYRLQRVKNRQVGRDESLVGSDDGASSVYVA